MTLWSCLKSGLIRKIRLISRFMTSQPDSQTITMHISSNISRSKDNQTVKFDQLIEKSRKIHLFKNYAENKAGRLAPDILLLFKKV